MAAPSCGGACGSTSSGIRRAAGERSWPEAQHGARFRGVVRWPGQRAGARAGAPAAGLLARGAPWRPPHGACVCILYICACIYILFIYQFDAKIMVRSRVLRTGKIFSTHPRDPGKLFVIESYICMPTPRRPRHARGFPGPASEGLRNNVCQVGQLGIQTLISLLKVCH